MGQRPARRRVRAGIAVLALASGLGGSAAGEPGGTVAAATGDGDRAGLGLLAGREGCVVADLGTGERAIRGCVSGGAGVFGGAAFSPDGRFLYVARPGEDSLVVFRRDRRTGGLRRLRGRRHCAIPAGARGGCVRARGLSVPQAVAVSEDGRNVYVSARSSTGGAIVSLRRSRRTGELAALRGPRGCVSEDGSAGACARLPRLEPPLEVVLDPDGGAAYALSGRARIHALRRAGGDGSLRPRSGRANCVSATGDGGACVADSRVAGALGLVADPRRRRAYLIAGEEPGMPGAIVTLRRSAGRLVPVRGRGGCAATGRRGCARVRGLLAPSAAVASRDGRHLYVTTDDPQSLVTVLRSEGNRLMYAACAGLGRSCAYTTPYGERPVPALSPDGRLLHVAGEGRMELYRRDPADGRLTRLDCLLEERFVRTGREDRCGTAARGFDPRVVLTPPAGPGAYAIGFRVMSVVGRGVRVLGGSTRATRAGFARIRVSCPAPPGRRCTGAFRLRAERDPPSPFSDRRVNVGGGRFSIPAGRSLIRVPLTRAARNRLARRGEFPIEARVRSRTGEAAAVAAGRPLRLLPPATARLPGRKPRSCARLGNVSVIARSGRTVVFRAFERPFADDGPDVLHAFACLGRRGRPQVLDSHDSDGEGTTLTGPVAAAGPRVAYALTVDETEQGLGRRFEHRLVVEHLGRRRTERDLCAGDGVDDAGCRGGVLGVVLTRRGGIAWAFTDSCCGNRVFVVKLDSGDAEPELLASGPEIHGRRLALRGARVVWHDRDGRRHSAPIS